MHRVTVPALGFRMGIVQKIEVGTELSNKPAKGQGPEIVIYR